MYKTGVGITLNAGLFNPWPLPRLPLNRLYWRANCGMPGAAIQAKGCILPASDVDLP